MEQEVATQVVGLGGSTDFGIIQLFLRADFIVKAVIIILISHKNHPFVGLTM